MKVDHIDLFFDREFDSVAFIVILINITNCEDKIGMLVILHMEIDEQFFIREYRKDVISGTFRGYLLIVWVTGL